MSIGRIDLQRLYNDLLQSSEVYVDIEKKIKILRGVTQDLVIESVFRNIPPGIRDFLISTYSSNFNAKTIPLGYTFAENVLGEKVDVRYYWYSQDRVTMIIPGNTDLSKDLPENVKYSLKSLNDRYLTLVSKKNEISDTLRGIITEETKMSWLKENLPGAYRILKSYENKEDIPTGSSELP